MKKHDPKKHPRYPKGTIINGVNVGGKFMPKEGRGNAAIGKNKLVRAISAKLEKAGKAPSKDANRRIMSAVAKDLRDHRASGGDDDQKTLRRVAQKAIAREVKAIVGSGDKKAKKIPSDSQRAAKAKQGKAAKAVATPKDRLSKETLALETIKELREKYDNYVPIYEYRAALSHLTRKQQDNLLYDLERQDAIELSALAEPALYSPKQRDQGIKQRAGGSLFFISLAAQ